MKAHYKGISKMISYFILVKGLAQTPSSSSFKTSQDFSELKLHRKSFRSQVLHEDQFSLECFFSIFSRAG